MQLLNWPTSAKYKGGVKTKLQRTVKVEKKILKNNEV